MKKVFLGCLALGATAACLAATTPTRAAGQVHTAADNCMNAHAMLVGTRGGDSAAVWQLIAGVMRANPHWQIVPDYEPMVSQKISFRQYAAHNNLYDTVYVGSCGHGATCNELARKFNAAYPESSPWVYCGTLPAGIDSPSSASL